MKVTRCSYRGLEIGQINKNREILRRKIRPAELRISRSASLKHINHPMYFIKYKEKEVALVGTPEYSRLPFEIS